MPLKSHEWSHTLLKNLQIPEIKVLEYIGGIYSKLQYTSMQLFFVNEIFGNNYLCTMCTNSKLCMADAILVWVNG